MESLLNIVSVHTYLILIAGTLYYMLSLEAANKHHVSNKKVQLFAYGGLLLSILAWSVKLTLLKEYYAGKAGAVTDMAVSPSISAFSIAQTYIFPVVILFGLMLALVVFREGSKIMETVSVRSLIIYLSFICFGLSAILMFLGVLVP